MTINQTFGNYELVTDESDGDRLVFRRVDTGNEIVVDDGGIDAERVSVTKIAGGDLLPKENKSFTCRLVDEPFPNATGDPTLFHKSHFDDGKYRLGFIDSGNNYVLYKTSNFDSYTQVSSGIGHTHLQDHVVKPDGTFVVYRTDEDTSPNSTEVLTGTDLTSLTNQGAVVNESDCGVFYDEANSTIHIYTEDSDNAAGVGSDKISHYTTPDDDLTNATQQSDALDVTGRAWHTGDPDIIQIKDTYYMFLDATVDHPYYHIALAVSTDLDNWSVVHSSITTTNGGDMVLTKNGRHYEAFTELTGTDQSGVGRWQVFPTQRLYELGVDGIALQGGSGVGEAYIRTPENIPVVIKEGTGTRLAEFADGRARLAEVLAFREYNSSPLIETVDPDDKFQFSSSGSGQIELTVGSGYTKSDLPGGEQLVPQSSKPSNPPSGEVKRVIADGTNWDPDSDGNAEAGFLLPSGSFVETTDFGTTL